VCELGPYHSRIPAREPEGRRVNGHLEKAGYLGDEYRWSLVAFDDKTIALNTYDTVRNRLFLNKFQIDRGMGEELSFPAGFVVKDCASSARAVLVKTRVENRIHIVFGEMR
jgi:hypothetical protein